MQSSTISSGRSPDRPSRRLDTKIIDGDLAPVPGPGIVLDRDGCIEVDDDPRHGGDKSLAALEERLGPLPPTLTVGGGAGSAASP